MNLSPHQQQSYDIKNIWCHLKKSRWPRPFFFYVKSIFWDLRIWEHVKPIKYQSNFVWKIFESHYRKCLKTGDKAQRITIHTIVVAISPIYTHSSIHLLTAPTFTIFSFNFFFFRLLVPLCRRWNERERSCCVLVPL